MVHAITEQMQNLDVLFGELRCGLKEQALELPTQEELRAVEERLSRKMAHIFRRIEEIERGLEPEPVFDNPQTG